MPTMLFQRASARAAALAIGLIALAPMVASATTWARYQAVDPITKRRVEVAQPLSSGSYIYGWPSKVDQVFWPYIDAKWLWFNPISGYIAFGGDFEKVEPAKVEKLKTWLTANYNPKKPPKSRLERLVWAEKVYAVREMDDDFWCHFYRLMAFETGENREQSVSYVRKAMPLLQERLDTSDDPGQRLQGLYLLGEYNRRLGNDAQSTALWERLRAFESTEKFAGYKSYLLAIAEEQRARPPKPPEH